MYYLHNELDFFVQGGLTRRYHTQDVTRSQTVAEHSFFVAWLIGLLYIDEPNLTDLMCYALAHDVAEGHTGDVSSPVKRSFPLLKEILDTAETAAWGTIGRSPPLLEDEDKRKLKLADYMEGMLFCLLERQRGNQRVREIYNNFCDYVVALKPRPGKEQEMFRILTNRWENASEK